MEAHFVQFIKTSPKLIEEYNDPFELLAIEIEVENRIIGNKTEHLNYFFGEIIFKHWTASVEDM